MLTDFQLAAPDPIKLMKAISKLWPMKKRVLGHMITKSTNLLVRKTWRWSRWLGWILSRIVTASTKGINGLIWTMQYLFWLFQPEWINMTALSVSFSFWTFVREMRRVIKSGIFLWFPYFLIVVFVSLSSKPGVVFVNSLKTQNTQNYRFVNVILTDLNAFTANYFVRFNSYRLL